MSNWLDTRAVGQLKGALQDCIKQAQQEEAEYTSNDWWNVDFGLEVGTQRGKQEAYKHVLELIERLK